VPIIQRPDLVAKVRKSFELTGPDAVSTISPELVPVVLVEDITERDPTYLDKYCIEGAYKAAVAAQYTSSALWNPADSGIDLILDEMRVMGTGTDAYTIRFWNSDPGAVSGTGAANRGIGRSGTPTARVRTNNAAAPLGATVGYERYQNTTIVLFRKEGLVRLQPGEGFGFTNNTVNLPHFALYLWRERLRP